MIRSLTETMTTKKTTERERDDERKIPTNIALRPSMVRRLALYTLEKYDGRAHLRNQIIEQAIDELLKREGY